MMVRIVKAAGDPSNPQLLPARSIDGDVGLDQGPLLVGDVAGVVARSHPISTPTDARGSPYGTVSERTERLEAFVWPGTAAEEFRRVGSQVGRHDVPEAGVDYPVHRPMERLARLHPPEEQPALGRPLLDLAVGRMSFPRDVPPAHSLVGRCRFPDGPGSHSVIEEHDQGDPPLASDRQGNVPAAGPTHRVGHEIEGVDLGLGQEMAAGGVALDPGPRSRGGATISFCSQAQERTARR
jgi:hypothetical protein